MRVSPPSTAPKSGRPARAIGLASALVFAFTLIPVSGAYGDEPDRTPRSGEYLAFVSERSGNDEIYLSRPDGSEIEQLTDSPGFDRAPSWGSSGTSLVFNSRRDPHVTLPQIYSFDIVSGKTTRLTESDQEEHRASLHEDSGKLFFHRGVFFQTAFELWEKDLATGTERQLTQSDNTSVWNAAPAVSPDGRELLFQSNRGVSVPTGPFPQKLHLLQLDSGEVTALPEPGGLDADVSYDGARWNHDGTAIVFSANTDEGSVLYIAERAADGSWANRAITDPAVGASAPAWSPTGAEIVFQAEHPDDEDLTDIVILNLANGVTRTIAEGRTPVWGVVKAQEQAAPTLAVEGLNAVYRPGDRLELTAHQTPNSGEDHWNWYIQRAGESAYSMLPSQVTSTLTIEQLTLAEDGAQIMARLHDRHGEVLAESAPVTLLVAERGEGGNGEGGSAEEGSGAAEPTPISNGGQGAGASSSSQLANTGAEYSPLLTLIPLGLLAGGTALLLRERLRRTTATE